MTSRSLRRSAFALVLGLLTLRAATISVSAWNPDGHMLVAFIAYRHLTPAARARVGELLALNPLHATWIAGLPANASAERRRRRAFVQASNWPDVIKGLPGYVSDGTDGGNTPPDSPEASQNIGYPDMNRHKYWHFVDVPFSDDGTATHPAASPNALTQITLFRDALASPSTPAGIKSYDLVWLIHVVGDVHQPLHAASRFRQNDADGDNGGNDVTLQCEPALACAAKLHAQWDGILGNTHDLAHITALGTSLDARPVPPGADIADPQAWITESGDRARADVYQVGSAAPLGDPVATLTAAYIANAKAVAELRVVLAAHRLAALINSALGAS